MSSFSQLKKAIAVKSAENDVEVAKKLYDYNEATYPYSYSGLYSLLMLEFNNRTHTGFARPTLDTLTLRTNDELNASQAAIKNAIALRNSDGTLKDAINSFPDICSNVFHRRAPSICSCVYNDGGYGYFRSITTCVYHSIPIGYGIESVNSYSEVNYVLGFLQQNNGVHTLNISNCYCRARMSCGCNVRTFCQCKGDCRNRCGGCGCKSRCQCQHKSVVENRGESCQCHARCSCHTQTIYGDCNCNYNQNATSV